MTKKSSQCTRKHWLSPNSLKMPCALAMRLLGSKAIIRRQPVSRCHLFAGSGCFLGSFRWGRRFGALLGLSMFLEDLQRKLLGQLQSRCVGHVHLHHLCVQLPGNVRGPSWLLGELYCARCWPCSRNVLHWSANSILHLAGEDFTRSSHCDSAGRDHERRNPVQILLPSVGRG